MTSTTGRTLRVAVLLLAILTAALAATTRPAYQRATGDVDVVIRRGQIVDGTGRPAYIGDVAIDGDRIVGVGALPAQMRGVREVDAAGLVVAPGFIDMLGQSERTIFRHPLARSKIAQGVTSEITGEVESPWPRWRGDSARGAWSSLDDYFVHLRRARPAINIGLYVSLGTVRGEVMGASRAIPSTTQLAAMGQLIDEAMCDGAFGVSAALLYPPASHFRTSELVTLAGHAAARRGGYATHLRSESDALLPSVDEAVTIGRESGAWVQVHHLKAAGAAQRGRMGAVVQRIRDARRSGVAIAADVYPYVASGAGLAVLLPPWVMDDQRPVTVQLADPRVRARVVAELSRPSFDPTRVVISEVHAPSLRPLQGLSLDSIARLWGETPARAMVKLLVADSARTGALLFSMDEADLERALQEPWVSIGIDGGAQTPAARSTLHPRAFGTFPRVFARYVRERRILRLEDAVHRMTAMPAASIGLRERGTLRAGYYADIAVFSASEFRDNATYASPARLATGMRYVLVNGVLTLDDGRTTGARAGRPLTLGRCAP